MKSGEELFNININRDRNLHGAKLLITNSHFGFGVFETVAFLETFQNTFQIFFNFLVTNIHSNNSGLALFATFGHEKETRLFGQFGLQIGVFCAF